MYPAIFMMWASMRDVVVLPLVPVIAAIGIACRCARREKHVDDRAGDVARLAFARCDVHAKPGTGIDLADSAAGVAIGVGNVRGQKIDAADIETDRGNGALGHLPVVRMHDVGDVDRSAAGREIGGRRR